MCNVTLVGAQVKLRAIFLVKLLFFVEFRTESRYKQVKQTGMRFINNKIDTHISPPMGQDRK